MKTKSAGVSVWFSRPAGTYCRLQEEGWAGNGGASGLGGKAVAFCLDFSFCVFIPGTAAAVLGTPTCAGVAALQSLKASSRLPVTSLMGLRCWNCP